MSEADRKALAEWNANHKTMVMLGVKDEKALVAWESILMTRGVSFRTFVEPDIGDQKTALAVIPMIDRKLFRKLRLYGQGDMK